MQHSLLGRLYHVSLYGCFAADYGCQLGAGACASPALATGLISVDMALREIDTLFDN